jgi:hypothetical protein
MAQSARTPRSVDPSDRRRANFAVELAKRTPHRRAVEVAIWGMPIVSVDAMRRAFFRDAGAKYGDILYFSKPADWKFQTTTPNASTLYVYFNFNTKDGPIVVDVPVAKGAGLFGTMLDAWQVPLADVGPEGEDMGKGGKYLIVPPGHEEAPPPYIPVRPGTCNGYALFRAIPEGSSEQDRESAIELVKSLRIYPLAQAKDPPPQRHIDIAGKTFEGVVRFDSGFYDALDRILQEEPVHERDMVAMAQLRSLGIAGDRPFAPSEETTQILNGAVAEAHALFMQGVLATMSYWDGSHWGLHNDAGPKTKFSFIDPDRYALDERGVTYFLAYAPPARLGAASFYLSGTQDSSGADLQGSESYRLTIPPDVPVNQDWSVTIYDLETCGFIRESPRITIDSYNEAVERNVDGSIDVYFSRVPPPDLDSNWLYTAPGKRWFAMFRFYGPQKAVFDKTWKLFDIEKIS